MSIETIETHSVTSLLDDARLAFDQYRDALSARIKLINDEHQDFKPAEVSKELQDLGRLLGIAVAQTKKAQLEHDLETGDPTFSLGDLDRARSEIGSRLACLRRAERSEGFSG